MHTPKPVLLLVLFALFALSSCSGKRLPETCHLKPESGQCRAAITRWYFDDRAGTCKAFIWGGCGGVAPFDTLDACAATCGTAQAPEASAP